MEAYYHNQGTMPHFLGHYRQRVSDFGGLSMGGGRIALPLARKIIVAAVKRIGKELLVQAAPLLMDKAIRKKTPKQALKNTVKKHNQKTSCSWTKQVPYEQKTQDSYNNKKKKNISSRSK